MYEVDNELFEKEKGVKLLNLKSNEEMIFVGDNMELVSRVVKVIKNNLEKGVEINWDTLIHMGIKFYEGCNEYYTIEHFELLEKIEYYL